MTRGFDKYEHHQGLELSLEMIEGVGTETQDWSKNALEAPTLTGPPAWAQMGSGLNLLSFNNATPDFIEIAAGESTELDFTAENFSLGLWVYPDSIALIDLINRGLDNTDGYELSITALGAIEFATNQAAASQVTDTEDGEIVATNWYHVMIVRDGASVRIYINGRDRTDGEGVHIAPLTSARKFLVGIYDDEATRPFDGRLWRPRAWVRALSREEVKVMFDTTKHYFGVG